MKGNVDSKEAPFRDIRACVSAVGMILRLGRVGEAGERGDDCWKDQRVSSRAPMEDCPYMRATPEPVGPLRRLEPVYQMGRDPPDYFRFLSEMGDKVIHRQ